MPGQLEANKSNTPSDELSILFLQGLNKSIFPFLIFY